MQKVGFYIQVSLAPNLHSLPSKCPYTRHWLIAAIILIHMPCPTALPSVFRTYVHKMTFRIKSRVLSSYWFWLWLYHSSVKTILLESPVTLSHLCFDDFPSYLQATFIRLIVDCKALLSLPPFPVCHPSSCSSFFPSFSATRGSWRRKKHYWTEPLFPSVDIDFYANSVWFLKKNLILPHFGEIVWFFAVVNVYCFLFDFVSCLSLLHF